MLENYESLLFFEDEDNVEYYSIFDNHRNDIKSVVELVAVERLHDNLVRDKIGNVYNPKYPGYDPEYYACAYRVDKKEHIDMISGMFGLEVNRIN